MVAQVRHVEMNTEQVLQGNWQGVHVIGWMLTVMIEGTYPVAQAKQTDGLVQLKQPVGQERQELFKR